MHISTKHFKYAHRTTFRRNHAHSLFPADPGLRLELFLELIHGRDSRPGALQLGISNRSNTPAGYIPSVETGHSRRRGPSACAGYSWRCCRWDGATARGRTCNGGERIAVALQYGSGALVCVLAEVRLVQHRVPDALGGDEHFVANCYGRVRDGISFQHRS